MKIKMRPQIEEKVGNSSSANNKIRIAVFGQHDVGKSALTVRFLTRRYIGEYKSNTDLLYRQSLALSGHCSLDIEIVDISTSPEPNEERKTFPVEEINRADGFVIVYSITDRSSFSTALQALADIHSATSPPTPTSTSTVNGSTCQPQIKPHPIPIALIGNKCDLEHLRSVEKAEGVSASGQFEGCQFYELSVAENSPEVYSSFQSIINSLANSQPQPKRKFSVSKMLGNLRLGRNSPSFPVPTSPASITDTNVLTNESSTSLPNSPNISRESSPGLGNVVNANAKKTSTPKHERQSSSDSSSSASSSSNFSISHLKSKLNSMKLRQNSPPVFSL